MDTYEATRVVFSRIQAVDPDNAAKIMGLLLIQDNGDKEMIRLAFGPDALLHSVVLNARSDLGLRLLPPPDSSPHLLSPTSWAPSLPFSRTNSSSGDPSPATNSPFYGGDLVDDRFGFLNGTKSGDLFYPEVSGECGSPGPYTMGWAVNGHHRRSCSVAELCAGSDAAGSGWKPCLYFARGHCKNGSSCRFLHGLPDDSAADATAAGSTMDAMVEQQCQELLLRSKSQRLSAAAFYPLTGAAPPSPSSTKCMNFLLQNQQQQNGTQRAVAAVAAAALMLGSDDAYNFTGRSRFESSDYSGTVNPVLRQIYLTFPAESTFMEEDVSNYFSIYGPVQDVRIPYQQKRMFGFVTFVYPETVRLILAKGNPHFVCDARVLVKPYKEKGKVPDKYRQQQQQSERGDFSAFTTTGLDSRDPYDLQHLGARILHSSTSCSEEILLRRKVEQQQQLLLQQAIELQGRRFMGLQLSPEDKSPIPHHPAAAAATAIAHGLLHRAPVNAAAADKEESAGEVSPNQDSDFHESFEPNLPDNPFAAPADSPPRTNSTHLFAATSTLDMAPFKSCFFQMPRFSSGHGAVEM